MEAGYNGRIGLHSLPQSEEFYLRIQMTDFGADEDHNEQLRYFEMTEEQARQFKAKEPT